MLPKQRFSSFCLFNIFYIYLFNSKNQPEMKIKYLIIGDIKLTPRDLKLIRHAILNHSNDVAACKDKISVNTIKTEWRLLHEKLRVPNRGGVAIWALTNGWGIDGNYHPKELTLFD
jgi:DNA-binding CsgD family transcriptional regulator